MIESCRFGYQEHDGARYCYEHGGFLEYGDALNGERRCDRNPDRPDDPREAP